MEPNAALRVIDIHSPATAKEYLRSAISDEALASLAAVSWYGSGGNIGSRWQLGVDVSRHFVIIPPHGQPGTQYGQPLNAPPKSPVRVGVWFDLSVTHGSLPAKPCLIGCLAWAAASQIWNDVVVTLRWKAAELESLDCFEAPEMPSSTPWLVSMSTPSWRDLSGEELSELPDLLASIGWSAIEALS